MTAMMDDSGLSMPAPQPGQPEISMAPLIDVVFLLLIFFMVATVFPENRGLAIEPPASQQAQSLPRQPLVLTIAAEGQVALGEQLIAVADIAPLVAERLRMQPDISVVLRVDRRATTELLIQVMDACKLAGVKQIGIVTDATPPRT